MKRIAVVGLLLAACASQAQQSWAERALQLGIDKAKEFVTGIQKEGRPLAEKMLKAAPDYYKGAKAEVLNFAKRVKNDRLPTDLIEKQKLVLELWRLRGAINVLALSDPSLLKTFGIDPKIANSLSTTILSVERLLKKAGFVGI